MDVHDEADWALLLRGDADAFGLIFDRHHDRLLRHSYRIVYSAAEAEDVVAIVFLEAWRHRNTVRFVNGSLLPWLLTTANYTAMNLARSARRYRAALARLPVTDIHEDKVDSDAGEAESALGTMSLKDRQIITLCIVECLSDAEAAAILSIPIGTVKSRLSRAKKRLADRILSPYPVLIEKTTP